MIITVRVDFVVNVLREPIDGNTEIDDGLLTPEDKRRLGISALFEIRSGVGRTCWRSGIALVAGGDHGRSECDAAVQHRQCIHGSTVQNASPHRLQLPRMLVYPCSIPLIRDEIARRVTRPSRFAQIHQIHAVGDVRSPVSVRGRDRG